MATERIIRIPIEDEMRQAYLDYAMSVIVARALPDVRDGLKPVHRRILYSMYDNGLFPDRKERKCAKICGDVVGRFHPHGDSAVYDALVRLGQDFSLRYPLIVPQGNFGSVDGDPPAAMRYTEAKLSRMAMEILKDIDKDTVNWRPTYDNTEEEPEVLPAGIPNLLVNGSTGIAVGMATNIPPHNLADIIDALVAMIDDPQIGLAGLMTIVKAPDFPTGGIIMGLDGVRLAYSTGRGSITVRARTAIEEIRKDRYAIVVTELPYQVNKARLVEKIAELVKDKRITGVSDIRDESDRKGMRVVIELQRDARGQVVLNQLFKHADLQNTFGVNIVALVDGSPRTLNLQECLHHYLQHRREVVERRTRFELNKAQERAHIVEGLLRALDHLDQVIATIRAATTVDEAKTNLMNGFLFTQRQAEAILDMRLQRLTGLERQKLTDEHAELIRLIAKLEDILSSEKNIFQVVRTELLDIKEKYKDARRTELDLTVAGSFDIEDLVPESEMVVTVSHAGYIKRMPLDTWKAQRRGGKGMTGVQLRDEDYLEHMFVTTTHHQLLIFTDQAKVYRLRVLEIPEASRQAKGTAIVNLLDLTNEKIAAIIPCKDFGTRPDKPVSEEGDEEAPDVVEDEPEAEEPDDADAAAADGEDEVDREAEVVRRESSGVRYLVMATRKGLIKKTPLYEYGNIRAAGLNAISINEGDELIGVKITRGDEDLVLLTKKGMGIRFREMQVPPKGRVTKGVKGMRLKKDDQVVAFVPMRLGESMQLVTNQGVGKRVGLSEFRTTRRGGQGVKAIRLLEDEYIVAAGVIGENDDIILATEGGTIIRMEGSQVSEYSRQARGVRLINVEEGDIVTSMAVVPSDEAEAEEDDPLA